MKTSLKIAILSAAVAVLAMLAVGIFMIVTPDGDDGAAAPASTVKAASAPGNDVSATQKFRVRTRNPRMRDPRLLKTPADRRLAVPEPIRRMDYRGGNQDSQADTPQRPAAPRDIGHAEKFGPVPPEVTIERAKKLASEGRLDDAKKLLRNSTLVERNPLNRQRLEQELATLGNPDGVKTTPAGQGQVK